jgi:hypothetical protein
LALLASENLLTTFVRLRRVLLSLLQHITLSTILSATARSSLEVHGTLLICPSLPRVAVDASVLTLDISTHTSEKELDTHILSTRQKHTTICLWGGFFNALLANLIYISGRLIFLATRIGEISSAFVFSTLMHQYSMMSKDYDRHTDLDLAMILFVFLD